jgi:hypothetical protein
MTPSSKFKERLCKAQNDSLSIIVKPSGHPIGGVFRFEVMLGFSIFEDSIGLFTRLRPGARFNWQYLPSENVHQPLLRL